MGRSDSAGKRHDVIVKIRRTGGGDRNVLRPRAAACQQGARPAQRFQHFVLRVGARVERDRRILRLALLDLDFHTGKPTGNRARTGVPVQPGRPRRAPPEADARPAPSRCGRAPRSDRKSSWRVECAQGQVPRAHRAVSSPAEANAELPAQGLRAP